MKEVKPMKHMKKSPLGKSFGKSFGTSFGNGPRTSSERASDGKIHIE